MPLELKLSFFNGVKDTKPKVEVRTWAQICERFSKPAIRPEKDGWLLSPATFNPPQRKKQNVESLSALVLDCDHQINFSEVVKTWSQIGLAAAIHTTHSHQRVTDSNPKGEDRVRVLLPLSRPISPSEFTEVWQWGKRVMGGRLDEATKDASRIFYTPAIAAADAPYELHIIDGQVLNPDSLPLAPDDVTARDDSDDGAYGRAALESEIERVLAAGKGERNVTLNRAAFALGSLVAAGVLGESEVRMRLHAAGESIGLSSREINQTLNSGLRAGLRQPRDIPQDKTSTPDPAPTDRKWETPAKFTNFPIPEFPLDALSPWVRDFVGELAHETQTPPEMGAMFALAVLAAIVAPEVSVNVRGNWTEPLNLYTIVALPPAHRKSTVHHAIVKPLVDFEEQLRQDSAADVAKEREARRLLQMRLEHTKKEAAKLEGRELENKKRLVADMAAELEVWDEPVLPQLVCDDVTPETLATLLKEQRGCMALLSSEGGIFDQMAGRYSNSTPNLDVFLKGHSGDMLRINRRDRFETVRNPRLTMALAVQPDVLRMAATKPGFRGRGLLGRILYVLPSSRLGFRDIAPQAVHQTTRVRYAEKILDLKQSPMMDLVRFSAEADELLQVFEAEIEKELGTEGSFSDLTDWGGKLVGHVCRLAAILHLADNVDELQPWPEEIPAAVVARAIAIGRCLSVHSQAVFADMVEDRALTDAKLVLKWIQRNQKTRFTRREVRRSLHRQFKSVAALDPVLIVLEEEGHIIGIDGTTRKKAQTFEVSPLAKADSVTAVTALSPVCHHPKTDTNAPADNNLDSTVTVSPEFRETPPRAREGNSAKSGDTVTDLDNLVETEEITPEKGGDKPGDKTVTVTKDQKDKGGGDDGCIF